MCTVVTQWQPDQPLRILAIRDELTTRPFDDPGAWWPDHPGVVGGRDRTAGGSWCVSDIAAGTSALVLNRPERHTGTPSRGVLPLAAIEHGTAWVDHVDHHDMASFILLLAGPDGVQAWTWTGDGDITHGALDAGLHLITSAGIDPDTTKGRRYAPRFAGEDWLDVVTAEQPSDDLDALLVAHPTESGEVYGTVFGQLLTTEPGVLHATYSRTPWDPDDWSELTLPQPLSDRPEPPTRT